MSENNTNPLLSFALFAFNQAPYIREAVEAALAQTYSPLQVILSDDASDDRTFEIMRDMASAYRGPHQVVLNRNDRTLGLAGHVNRIMELARGEFVMSAAGDDISLPDRALMIWKAWEDSGRKAVAIQSATLDIDENGCALDGAVDRTEAGSNDDAWAREPSISNYVRTLKPGTVGCAFAFNPLVFSTFGPLPPKLIHEDNAIALRALCLGKITFIPTPLVKRRFHGGNLCSRRHEMAVTRETVIRQEDRMRRDAENRMEMYKGFLADLRAARMLGLISLELWREVERECARRLRLFAHQAEYVDATFGRKIRIIAAVQRDCEERGLIRWMLPRLIPRDLFRRLKTAGNSARLAIRQNSEQRPSA